MTTKIRLLNLNTRAKTCLRAYLGTHGGPLEDQPVSVVANCTAEELLALPSFGPGTLEHIRRALAQFGLRLKADDAQQAGRRCPACGVPLKYLPTDVQGLKLIRAMLDETLEADGCSPEIYYAPQGSPEAQLHSLVFEARALVDQALHVLRELLESEEEL